VNARLPRHRLAWGAVGFLWLSACAPSSVYVSNTLGNLHKVAVLLVSNDTNDLDGPGLVRGILFRKLSERGYDLVPLNDIDAKLKEQGFTDGGQLRAATPQQLGQWIGADTLFYITLEEFNYINVGFYWQRKVKIAGKLVEAKTGERLWEAERNWSTQAVVTNKEQAERQFAFQLAAKAFEKMTHLPLQAESQMAAERLLSTLPYRH
jgi:hypothetical protein